MLQIDGEKMRKSLGNVIWAKDYIERFGSNVTRWLLLSTHYRLILNISEDTINQALKEIERIEAVVKQVSIELELNGILDNNVDMVLFESFLKPLQDDLNVANAQVVLFETIKQLNQALRTKDKDYSRLSVLLNTFEKMLDILGIEVKRMTLSDEDKALFSNWDQAKKSKDFETADSIRKALQEKGYL